WAAVIVALGSPDLVSVAKASTTTIPIVFLVGEDPVRLGLVASLARPGGNMTGVNLFNNEITAKRLALLRELLPTSVRVAALVNPTNATIAETTAKDVEAAARAMGLHMQVQEAGTTRDIDAACASSPAHPWGPCQLLLGVRRRHAQKPNASDACEAQFLAAVRRGLQSLYRPDDGPTRSCCIFGAWLQSGNAATRADDERISLRVSLVKPTFARERTDALFVAGDPFFNSRRIQLVHLASHHRLPATYASRAYTDIGGR